MRSKGTVYDMGIHTPMIFSWKNVIKPGSVYKKGIVSSIDLAPTFLDIAGAKIPATMYGNSIKQIFTDQNTEGRKYIFAERNWHGLDEHIRCIRSQDYKFIVNAYTWLPHGTPGDLSSSLSWFSLMEAKRNGSLSAAQQRLFECPRPTIELYDLKNDPYELNNLAASPNYLEIGKQLSKELTNWMKATHDYNSRERRRDDENDRITGFPYSGIISKEYWND